jgi:uncharacterized protein with GYD domain
MAKYLGMARYTAEGTHGLMKDGGSGRVATVTKMVKKLGGKVESFYFAYGEFDAYVIVDIPDEAAALALSLAVNGSGKTTIQMVPLITEKQMDDAVKTSVNYRAPGD